MSKAEVVAPLCCLDCLKPYSNFPLDSTLPNEQWRMIHDGDGGVLCANCMVARAAKLPGAVALRMRIEFSPTARSRVPREDRMNDQAKDIDIETVVTCLEDDAARLLDENPDDEIAHNMQEAAALIHDLQRQIAKMKARPDPLGEALNSGDGAYRP